jgi:hypothetical protein
MGYEYFRVDDLEPCLVPRFLAADLLKNLRSKEILSSYNSFKKGV